jgi:hypothetical protein
MEAGAAVIQNKLINGAGFLLVCCESGGDNLAARQPRLAQLQLRNPRKPAPVFIARRTVQQQFANGPNPQASQLRGALGTNIPNRRHRQKQRR